MSPVAPTPVAPTPPAPPPIRTIVVAPPIAPPPPPPPRAIVATADDPIRLLRLGSFKVCLCGNGRLRDRLRGEVGRRLQRPRLGHPGARGHQGRGRKGSSKAQKKSTTVHAPSFRGLHRRICHQCSPNLRKGHVAGMCYG